MWLASYDHAARHSPLPSGRVQAGGLPVLWLSRRAAPPHDADDGRGSRCPAAWTRTQPARQVCPRGNSHRAANPDVRVGFATCCRAREPHGALRQVLSVSGIFAAFRTKVLRPTSHVQTATIPSPSVASPTRAVNAGAPPRRRPHRTSKAGSATELPGGEWPVTTSGGPDRSPTRPGPCHAAAFPSRRATGLA